MNREKLQQVIRILLVTGFLVGCGSTRSTPPPDKILFIGNSLTFANVGVYYHLEQLAKSAKPPRVITADKAVMGGVTLKTLWEDSPSRDLIGKGIYDVVVLQEDLPETDPATGVDTFHKLVRQFDAEIKKAGARTVLFMAWSYERPGWITMDQIAQAHRDIATELGIDVAPVGLAFQRVKKERPDLDMLRIDGEHPNIYGTYLATNVVYATVFGESPIGLPYLPPEDIFYVWSDGDRRGITKEEAAFLQRIAWETVQGYRAQQ